MNEEDTCGLVFQTTVPDRTLRHIKVEKPARQAFRKAGKNCWTPQAVCLTEAVTDYRSKVP